MPTRGRRGGGGAAWASVGVGFAGVTGNFHPPSAPFFEALQRLSSGARLPGRCGRRDWQVLGGAESEAARACEMLEAGPRRLRPSLPSLREVRSKFRPESKAASGKRGHVPPECWRRGGSGAEGSLAALASTESSRVPRVSECPRHFPSCDPSALRPALHLPFAGRLPSGSPLFQWQCKASR